MRVTFVLDSLVAGGAERSTVALMPALIERGVQPEVAILHDRTGLQGELRSIGVPVYDVSGGGGRIGWVSRLRALFVDRRPDLVHTSLYEADLCGRVAAWSMRTPVVSTLATVRYGDDHFAVPGVSHSKLRLARFADRSTARLTTQLHAVSDHVADEMAVNLRHPRDRIVRVHRGRPVPAVADDSELAQLRAQLGIGDRSVVLAVARHEWVKGLDRLLASVPMLIETRSDVVVLIAGRDGEQTSELRKTITENGLDSRVQLLGNREDVAALLALSDVFVLPSRREGLPGAVIEAMAAGCAVVASDIPQVREVVDDTCALLVDASDPSMLAEAVISTLEHPERTYARVTRARTRFADSFTLDRIADQMVEFYGSVLAQA